MFLTKLEKEYHDVEMVFQLSYTKNKQIVIQLNFRLKQPKNSNHKLNKVMLSMKNQLYFERYFPKNKKEFSSSIVYLMGLQKLFPSL